jgi:hypothetical protein
MKIPKIFWGALDFTIEQKKITKYRRAGKSSYLVLICSSVQAFLLAQTFYSAGMKLP